MKIFIDTKTWAIVKEERESPFLIGEIFKSNVRFYFNSQPLTFFPTVDVLKSNGRRRGPFSYDVSGCDTEVIDDTTWYYFDFTLSSINGVIDTPGELLITCSINFTNDSGTITGKRVVNIKNNVVKTAIYGDGNVIVMGEDAESILLDAARNITEEQAKVANLDVRVTDLKDKVDSLGADNLRMIGGDETSPTISDQILNLNRAVNTGIPATYETKTDASAKLTEAKQYTDNTIPKKVSQLENDEKYLKDADLSQFAKKTNLPTKVSELENDLKFVDNTVNDLVNYYLKTETYTRQEVLDLANKLPKFTILPVEVLPSENISTTTIYLVKIESEDETNIHEEYIYVNEKWELIGNTKVDLSQYYTKTETDALLDGKVDKVEGKGLSTNDYTTSEKTKLAGLENYDDTELREKIDSIEPDAIIDVSSVDEIGGWQGTTVPNTGTVEKVYFNTEMSIDEIVNILSQLTYNEDMEYSLFKSKLLGETNVTSEITIMMIPKEVFIEQGLNINIDIFAIFANVSFENNDIPVFLNIDPSLIGWGDVAKQGWNVDYLEFNINAVNNEVGLQNDLLSSIISTTPFTYANEKVLYRVVDYIGTPVAISGQIEKVYLNTELSHDKVIEICKGLNYLEYDGFTLCPIFSDTTLSNALFVSKIFDSDFEIYQYLIVYKNGDNEVIYFNGLDYNYDDIPDNIKENVGWQDAFNGIVEINNESAVSSLAPQFNFTPVNENVSNLFSLTPFQSTSKLYHIKNRNKYQIPNDVIIEVEELPTKNIDEQSFYRLHLGWDTEKIVPNTGTINKVYFNTKLSADEVKSILANLTYVSNSYLDYPISILLASSTGNPVIFAVKGSDAYDIVYATDITDSNTQQTIFTTMISNEVGWKISKLDINAEVVSEFNGLSVGSENSKLNLLFATMPEKTPKIYHFVDDVAFEIGGTSSNNSGNVSGEVPTKVSQLENDANYISKENLTDGDYDIESASVRAEVVQVYEQVLTSSLVVTENINGKDINEILNNVTINDVEELPETTLVTSKVQPNGIYGSGSKLYLNTDLIVQEVRDLLKNLTYDYVDGDNAYSILISNETHTKYVMAQRNQTSWYGIVSSDYGVVFSSSERPSIANFKGWKDDFDGIVLTDAGACFNTVTIDGITYNCGVNNADLLTLFSTKPFEYIAEFGTNVLYRLENKLHQFNGIKWVMIGEEAILDIDELPSLNGTTIPNSGYVDTIYLNTQLGIDEVTAICKKVTLDSNYKYWLLRSSDSTIQLEIYNSSAGEDDTFIIRDIRSNKYYWTNDETQANYYWQGSAGWNPNSSNVIEIKNDVLSSYSGSVGTENDKITELFSLTPFKAANESVFYRIGTKLYHTKGGTFYEIGGYSKEEIDTMIGDINSILDTLNGEVV